MKPITDRVKHIALFFDDSGHYVGKEKIKYKERKFAYNRRIFNFLPNQGTFFKIRNIFSTKKYYIYNLNDPNPIKLEIRNSRPVLNSQVYHDIIESDLIKKLNDVHKFSLLSILEDPKKIIIVIAIIFGAYYLLSGGTIT